MEIQTIDKATYKRLKKICDKAQAYWDANATGNRLSKELAAHKDYARCPNEMRGLVEQYEILRDLPPVIYAYMTLSREAREATNYHACRQWLVTTWTGLPLGTANEIAKWGTTGSRISSTMSQFKATIGGRTYTGRGAGSGMCVSLRETAESVRKRQGRTLERVTHKSLESACGAYNFALGLKCGDAGYLMWADIRGDGSSQRGLWSYSGQGGVGSSDIRKRGDTMRQTKQRIYLSIKFHKLPSFAVIIQAIHERGATQQAALRELAKRGLWLSADQKKEAGL